jgi:hypothetical protein
VQERLAAMEVIGAFHKFTALIITTSLIDLKKLKILFVVMAVSCDFPGSEREAAKGVEACFPMISTTDSQ